MSKILEKFLKYVSFDTQSDEESMSSPSTKKQKLLGAYLVKELKKYGVKNAYLDNYGYVYGKIASNTNSDVTLGLIAHMDTSPDASGKDVKPQLVEYKEGNILINKDLNMFINEKTLLNHRGHRIIHTDGTTLLGADDKAGIAIIMEIVERLYNNKDIKHPAINIAFTPDEEVGRGTEHFNYEYFKKDTKILYSYTLDGDDINIINYENFNAASAEVVVNGVSIHPGSAKNIMVNSQLLAMEFNGLLPKNARPENTEGYEGFNHLHSIVGDVTKTTLKYIIRNHDIAKFNEQKQDFINITKKLNKKYGEGTFITSLRDRYFNMVNIVNEHKEVLDLPIEALKKLGIESKFEPIRGGTDGATLSFNGIVCPNLGTGCGNYHGPYEFADLDDMETMVEVILTMFSLV